MGKIIRRLVPIGRPAGTGPPKGIFYYPRGGFGQISEALASAGMAAGAQIRLQANAKRIVLGSNGAHAIEVDNGTTPETLSSRHVWSTIPVTTLVRLVEPAAPHGVLAAASRLRLRAMLLVYLVLGTDRFTEFDAHYFPEAAFPFTRVSEPKNYADLRAPEGRTVLCAEIPCGPDEPVWSSTDDELGGLVADGLARAGLPVRAPLLDVVVRRLPAAYPIYKRGYEEDFELVDRWVSGLDGVLSFGRQGLYAHDNTHHALYMALAAASCLSGDTFDSAAWGRYRKEFESHVVED
jgi:protoporphyrinogen oxidase